MAGAAGASCSCTTWTVREALENHLASQALTDDLTKIGNRRHFLERTRRALIEASRGDDSVAVIFVDIDDFKQINDAYGHDCGDAILIAIAQRLEESIRPQDTAARLGGDEFAVLLGHIGDEAPSRYVSGSTPLCGVPSRWERAHTPSPPASGSTLPRPTARRRNRC